MTVISLARITSHLSSFYWSLYKSFSNFSILLERECKVTLTSKYAICSMIFSNSTFVFQTTKEFNWLCTFYQVPFNALSHLSKDTSLTLNGVHANFESMGHTKWNKWTVKKRWFVFWIICGLYLYAAGFMSVFDKFKKYA